MPYISKKQFKQYIERYDFTNLFNQLGWNYVKHQDPVKVNDYTYKLHSVAEKSGFRILLCEPDNKGKIPDYVTRIKLDRAIARLYREHLTIFIDKEQKTQLWQWVWREPGKPPEITETVWYRGQEPELLYQKTSGLFFTLDEEENITIVDVTGRVRENFQQNREKVTKKFYEGFKQEHKKFLDFIKGIADKADREWYASLMLNRLMFCYFIQKKGFLDKNRNYLRDKLQSCQQKRGKNQFYSFYRDFLLALFHRGLGSPGHSSELVAELGRIPYLNGGLFDIHKLEKDYQDIEIEDKAFERVFKFFDEWNWHLDTRETASGKDINPDVLGYIFEKYINDRAQMGAYYTKEDITDYISKNCILPYLFDETERKHKAAFAPQSWIWSMLKNSGDAYIYEALKYGIDPEDPWGDLPEDVKEGLNPEQPDLLEKRRCWNRLAPSEAALPTEIWREVIERRKRYMEVRSKIENGEITHVNDFITCNLNIRQFTRDVIESCEDPVFLLHFYKSLAGDGKRRKAISILDPTCGSGAFLFAAMNILEPLYEACLHRMEEFTVANPKKHKYFAETLEQVKAPEHPNRQYFIFKSIILNNLYGVDIMHEAVEIAKLRLFLKLVATVEPDYAKPNLGLEPLPDVDYNIRAGNTLIGYAREEEIERAFAGQLDFDNDAGRVKERCEQVAMAFNRYKEIQLGGGEDYQEFHQAKKELEQRLDKLNHDLNILLHKKTSGLEYDAWLNTHQPFHWLAEFYEIIHDRGGFDVIIGNPPYVEYSKVKEQYTISGYSTEDCGNLYAFVIERCTSLLRRQGFIGMIIQLPIVCTDRMIPLQNHIKRHYSLNYFSTYDDRPGKLFDGLEHIRATIFISHHSDASSRLLYTTVYHRWYTGFRPFLFDNIGYFNSLFDFKGSIPKVGNGVQEGIISKLGSFDAIGNYFDKNTNNIVYYHNAPQYWIRATSFIPFFWNERDGEKPSSQVKKLSFKQLQIATAVNSIINSSLFYIWFILLSDCRHLNMREIISFPIGLKKMNSKVIKSLNSINSNLMDSYKKNKERKSTFYKTTGKVEYDEFYPGLSKSIIDQIDTVLAEHYGFTPEELDFIINYDIKYRMGKELWEEGEDV